MFKKNLIIFNLTFPQRKINFIDDDFKNIVKFIIINQLNFNNIFFEVYSARAFDFKNHSNQNIINPELHYCLRFAKIDSYFNINNKNHIFIFGIIRKNKNNYVFLNDNNNLISTIRYTHFPQYK